MRIKDFFGCLIKSILLILAASSIAVFLLWCVYLLPTDSMAKNVVLSMETLEKQVDTEKYVTNNWSEVYDTATNVLIIYEAIYPNTENTLEDAMLVPSATVMTIDYPDLLSDLLKYTEERIDKDDYNVAFERYWHGYLVFLKPLLLFMDLHSIYILNTMVLVLITITIAILIKKRLGNYWIAYVVTVLLMKPIYIMQSIQLSTVFYAMQITLLLLLIREKWKKEQLCYVFIIDGILLSFLGYLTYPAVAFGIPLLTCYLLYHEGCFKNDFIMFIIEGISFVVGYIGMWGMKWVFTSIITGENAVLDGILNVLHRTGVVEDEIDDMFVTNINVYESITRNLDAFFNNDNYIILMVAILVLIVIFILNRKKLTIDNNLGIICFIIACVPIVWMIVVCNHCTLHPHLEWRTYSILIYAIMVFLISTFTEKRRCVEWKT